LKDICPKQKTITVSKIEGFVKGVYGKFKKSEKIFDYTMNVSVNCHLLLLYYTSCI